MESGSKLETAKSDGKRLRLAIGTLFVLVLFIFLIWNSVGVGDKLLGKVGGPILLAYFSIVVIFLKPHGKLAFCFVTFPSLLAAFLAVVLEVKWGWLTGPGYAIMLFFLWRVANRMWETQIEDFLGKK